MRRYAAHVSMPSGSRAFHNSSSAYSNNGSAPERPRVCAINSSASSGSKLPPAASAGRSIAARSCRSSIGVTITSCSPISRAKAGSSTRGRKSERMVSTVSTGESGACAAATSRRRKGACCRASTALRCSASAGSIVHSSSAWSITSTSRASARPASRRGASCSSAWSLVASARLSASPSARLSPRASDSAAAMRSNGCGPGLMGSRYAQFWLPGSTPPLSSGSNPARTTLDLPLPDAPSTARNEFRRTRSIRSVTSSSRP